MSKITRVLQGFDNGQVVQMRAIPLMVVLSTWLSSVGRDSNRATEQLLQRNSWQIKIKDMTESNHINTGTQAGPRFEGWHQANTKPLISFLNAYRELSWKIAGSILRDANPNGTGIKQEASNVICLPYLPR